MKMEWVLKGEDCFVEVLDYSPEKPMLVYGSGYGDAHPGEDECFELVVTDLGGPRSDLLDSIDEDEAGRIIRAYLGLLQLQQLGL